MIFLSVYIVSYYSLAKSIFLVLVICSSFCVLIFKLILQAESLVKSQQDMGETMGELGLAFVKLTKLETDEAVFESQRARATDMKNFATVAVKASRLYRELNSQTVKHLVSLYDSLLSGICNLVILLTNKRSVHHLLVRQLLTTALIFGISIYCRRSSMNISELCYP